MTDTAAQRRFPPASRSSSAPPATGASPSWPRLGLPTDGDNERAEREVDQAELRWLKETYKGDERQLTVRFVILGMLLGVFLCGSNLYVVLKTGWSIGVTVTASIVAWALFAALRSLRVPRCHLSVLENNSVATDA